MYDSLLNTNNCKTMCNGNCDILLQNNFYCKEMIDNKHFSLKYIH